MGLFDTIHLQSPLVCPTCGTCETTYQTHAFEDSMADYRIGSVVRGGVLSGIVQESFWCDACHKAGNRTELPVYLVIWHSILVGVDLDLARAETLLASVDRLDLVAWLDEAQRQETEWKRRFYGLFHDVRRWSEHLEQQEKSEPVREGESPEQTKRRMALAALWSLPDEILSASDPLAAILARNTPSSSSPTSNSTP
jgi:hypothetical protein